MDLILPGDDLVDVARLVRDGDPVVGWRGDPTMDVYVDRVSGDVVVYGFDRCGERFVAARENARVNPGWRHGLLRRLRDGDWRRGADVLFAELDAENERVRREREHAVDEVAGDGAERLAWALRRDVGHVVGGLTREVL